MPSETGADLIGAHMYTFFIESVRKTEQFDKQTLNDMLIKNRAEYLAAT
jgi:predicted regulator of Ras-like GTPase activity (Roadblock/LC7/MglB family)